jgi:hypothetical protein
MFIFLLSALFAAEAPVSDPNRPHPFNLYGQVSQIDDDKLSQTIGAMSALAYDLRKGIGLRESNSYIAKYFRTNTSEGKKAFWEALAVFHANMPHDESLIGAHNFLVGELTRYYQLSS